MAGRSKRLRIATVVWGLFLFGWSVFSLSRKPPPPRPLVMPPSRFLSVMSRVDAGAEGGAMAPPELSITAPGGASAGFGVGSQVTDGTLPGAEYERLPRSAADGPSGVRILTLSAADDGTYGVQVIGTATGRYGIQVTAQGVSSAELSTAITRELRDVPIVAGTVHRYDVEYVREGEDSARLSILATDPSSDPQRRVERYEAQAARSRLSLTIGGCGPLAPLVTVGLTTPGGRSAGFDREGASYGADVPGLCFPDGWGKSLDFLLRQPADGEYAIEISPTAGWTAYSLYASLTLPDGSSSVQPLSVNCASTTLAPGDVHRWILRVARDAAVPLRVVERPDRCVPPMSL